MSVEVLISVKLTQKGLPGCLSHLASTAQLKANASSARHFDHERVQIELLTRVDVHANLLQQLEARRLVLMFAELLRVEEEHRDVYQLRFWFREGAAASSERNFDRELALQAFEELVEGAFWSVEVFGPADPEKSGFITFNLKGRIPRVHGDGRPNAEWPADMDKEARKEARNRGESAPAMKAIDELWLGRYLPVSSQPDPAAEVASAV